LRQPLRAADAFQLAAAIIWADGEPEGRNFVSYDKRLRDAARSEGFTVIPVQYEG
jgi:predicted nucleic acid-binding protein